MAVASSAELTAGPRPRPRYGPIRRLRVRLTGSLLDARIAAGEFAPADADLACRSVQLVSMCSRRSIAQGLDRVLRRSRDRPSFSATIPQDQRAVRLARPMLETLAAALRSDQWVHPRGVALTRLFLTDPGSALYLPSYPEELFELAQAALLALGPASAPHERVARHGERRRSRPLGPSRRRGSAALLRASGRRRE